MPKITKELRQKALESAAQLDREEDEGGLLGIDGGAKRWYFLNVSEADERLSLHEVGEVAYDRIADFVWDAIEEARKELEK